MVEQLETNAVDKQQKGLSDAETTSQGKDEALVKTTIPVADANSPADEKQKKYQAIARVQGELIADGQKLFIVADGDGARFAVIGIRPGKLSLKLVTLLPEERRGLFGFWPQEDNGVVIASFCEPENYIQHGFGPHLDEMLLSGRIKSCHTDKFVVLIKRNKGNGRGNQWFKGTSITVSSAPPSTLQSGQWADLKLQRSGSQWVLPDSSEHQRRHPVISEQ